MGPCPDACVTGVRHENSIFREPILQLTADSLGPHRGLSGIAQLSNFSAPLGDALGDPFLPLTTTRVGGGGCQHLAQSRSCITTQRDFVWIVTTEFFPFDVQLDDPGARTWNLPLIGHLTASMAADKEDEVGRRDDLVGAAAAVKSYDTRCQRMVFGNCSLGVQRCGNWKGHFFGEFNYFSLGAGGRDASSSDHNRFFGCCQDL